VAEMMTASQPMQQEFFLPYGMRMKPFSPQDLPQLLRTSHRNGSGTTAKLERVARVQRGTPPWPNAIAPVQLLPLRKTLLDARGNALAHLRAYQGRRTTLASAHHSNPIVTLPAKH
jgi:hypothetical protein